MELWVPTGPAAATAFPQRTASAAEFFLFLCSLLGASNPVVLDAICSMQLAVGGWLSENAVRRSFGDFEHNGTMLYGRCEHVTPYGYRLQDPVHSSTAHLAGLTVGRERPFFRCPSCHPPQKALKNANPGASWANKNVRRRLWPAVAQGTLPEGDLRTTGPSSPRGKEAVNLATVTKEASDRQAEMKVEPVGQNKIGSFVALVSAGGGGRAEIKRGPEKRQCRKREANVYFTKKKERNKGRCQALKTKESAQGTQLKTKGTRPGRTAKTRCQRGLWGSESGVRCMRRWPTAARERERERERVPYDVCECTSVVNESALEDPEIAGRQGDRAGLSASQSVRRVGSPEEAFYGVITTWTVCVSVSRRALKGQTDCP